MRRALLCALQRFPALLIVPSELAAPAGEGRKGSGRSSVCTCRSLLFARRSTQVVAAVIGMACGGSPDEGDAVDGVGGSSSEEASGGSWNTGGVTAADGGSGGSDGSSGGLFGSGGGEGAGGASGGAGGTPGSGGADAGSGGGTDDGTGGADGEGAGGASGGVGGTSGSGGAVGAGGSASSEAIEVWYAEAGDLVIGGAGQPAPQRWVNVMGRITEPAVRSSTYRLNGGPAISFPRGPTSTRLLSPGDFNLEIERSLLQVIPGTNTLDIQVEAQSGAAFERQVTLRVYPPAEPSPQLLVDWTDLESVGRLPRVASVVDGLWRLTDDGVRTALYGYDRLIAVGSQSWASDYEVLTDFVVHHFRSWGGVGVAVGWQGHAGDQEPREDWPLSALGWIRNVVPQAELQLMTFRRGVLARRDFNLETNVRYLVRVRTERLTNGPQVSINIWRANAPPPAGWLLSTSAPDHDGSVLLVAHHADLTWGPVQVIPLR